jgi:enamine deaminase RidA (YjgF/YER057c/UK114 family)
VTHEFLNPAGLAPPVGFSHVALPAPGRLVLLAGQTAHRADGTLSGETMTEQFEAAAANVVAALQAAGAAPHDLVWLQIFVVDVDAYRHALGPIGAAWRTHFGAHYPPMALFGVSRLFAPDALVELMGMAVIPELG